MNRSVPGQGMYSNTQPGEWPRNNEQDQQQQQRPLSAVRNTVNLGSTPMARPPPQQSNSNPAPYSRTSSFFSSFRKNSKPDPVESGSISPSTMSSGYSGHPNQAQQVPHTVGAAGQRRPNAGNWDEQGRTNSMALANDRPQALTQGRSGSGGPSKLISPRVQAVQAQSVSHSPSNSMSSAASSVGRRGSSYMKTIATRNANGEIHPEIQQVVTLTLAHSSKIYCSGALVRRLERNPDGTIVKDAKWVDVWAQLGGTTLSVWEAEAIKKASEEGREEPPTYINVTDSQVQVLGSIMTAATTSSPEQKRTNIVTINTAGSNLILFACPSPQTLLSWATALRLASWEKSRIEEIYTGHLFRLSMMEGNQFREPESPLQKGKLEGWAKVRIGGGTEWQRLWVVISLYAVSGSIDAGRPGSPNGSVKKNRLSGFLSGSKSTPSLSGHGASAPIGGPMIAMYPSNKTKDKKRLLYTAKRISQAFAVYPERPEVINQSSLFKIESTIKDEQLYSMTQSRDRAVEAREGYALIMPEVENGRPGAGEMIKWLIAVHDAFKLYGRPEGYSWDPRNPRSMFFTYPYGPYRDHLFLDRELAEVLDVRIHETSRIRGALMNILIQRMHAPPPDQSQVQVERRRGPDGQPQLPPLNFNANEQGGGVDHNGRRALTTIQEPSTMSADSHPGVTQNQPVTVHQPGSFNDRSQNQTPPARNGTSDPHVEPPVPSNSVSPGPPNTYAPLTSANFASQPSEGTRSSPATPAKAPSPTPSNPFTPPIAQVGGSGYRAWSPQAGGETLTKRPNGSTTSFGTQNAPKLSLETNSRTGSPLPVRNGTPARDPAAVNYQQMSSIPSIRTPSDPANYHQADISVANPSHLRPSQQATSYHTAQPGSNPIASSSRNPASSERPDSHLYNEAGALYLLSQMDDEPPEVSPLRDLPPQPLPPRLAALERQRANSAGGIDNTEPSPFANNSGGASPFASPGSVVAQQNPQSNPFGNAFASGSGNSNAARPSLASEGLAAVAFEYDPKSQTQPKIVQTQPSSSVLPQTAAAAEMHPNQSGNYQTSGAMTTSPLAMTSRSVEQQEEGHANADALAALSFVDAPNSPEEPKAKTSAPRRSPPTPVSASTSGSEKAGHQYQARSSFAPTAKSVERKTNSEAHQAAIQDSRSKPGRGKGKAASKGQRAWGSSDEEEDDEQEEEDSGDERTASKIPNQQSGHPSILSPLPQPHPTHPTPMSELSHAAHPSNDSRTASSRRLPAIPGVSGQNGRSPTSRSPDSNRGQEQYRPQEYSQPSSLDPHSQQRRPMDYTDEFGRRGPAESGSRGTLDRQAQTVPNRPLWSTMLDPQGETQGKATGRDTFVRIEPNETMTMAFQPQGLLQAGMADKKNRSAKQQEANARETGASLINVPNPPPPPQMGLVGAITAHQRDREREGGVGAALTEKERERRLAEERQRKYDELQRAQLDKAMSLSGNNMEMQQGYNPMLLNPMMGWGMPMMYGMNGMGMGGMAGWGGMSPQQQQQQQQQQYQMWAAQQAAMQAYQQAMISFSQAGSQAGSDAGGPQDTPTGRPGTTSPIPGWGPSPMASPMMAPVMPGVMPGMMPGMMPPMGLMPGMMPGYGMGNGSGFIQPGMSPSGPRSPINDDSRFSLAHTPQGSPHRLDPTYPGSRDNHAS